MFPPSQSLTLDIDAISQICGSVSIACWIVVFSPQIIENWRRGSADGLSIVFIVVWLLGDLFNILGAVLQGVLPTMVILAVYYTLADIVLLFQCFYYKGFTLRDIPVPPKVNGANEAGESSSSHQPTEHSPLLSQHRDQAHITISATQSLRQTINGHHHHPGNGHGHHTPPRITDADRKHSHSSLRERLLSLDGTHLSPVTPFIPETASADIIPPSREPRTAQSTLRTLLFNLGAVLLVCLSGVLGWWFSVRTSSPAPPREPDNGAENELHLNLWGQIFGYICAVLYLGSRVPQLLLNHRRKSTEGVSMLFFLFACIGNLTYVLSIFAYSPVCRDEVCAPGEARRNYARYILVNASWVLGSWGTLCLDAAVFVQYFMYRVDDEEGEDSDEEGGSVRGVSSAREREEVLVTP